MGRPSWVTVSVEGGGREGGDGAEVIRARVVLVIGERAAGKGGEHACREGGGRGSRERQWPEEEGGEMFPWGGNRCFGEAGVDAGGEAYRHRRGHLP